MSLLESASGREVSTPLLQASAVALAGVTGLDVSVRLPLEGGVLTPAAAAAAGGSRGGVCVMSADAAAAVASLYVRRDEQVKACKVCRMVAYSLSLSPSLIPLIPVDE